MKKGETKTFEFENTASASMLIHKIDSVTKKGIQGVKFVVYDSSMTPIGEYESDDQGYVHLNKTLEDGKYYVREIVAAEGYILDNKVKSFTVLAGDTAMIEWENTSELGQIQVIKTSEGYSSVNGLPAGTPLSGAIFAVYDKQNNVVDKFQTNENGIGSSKKLPLGIYTVKEVQAPANYGLNPTVFTADIEFAGQVVKLNVTDPVITAGVSIKKTGYAQTMNNNIMRWTVSGVRNDSTTSLQSFYWRDTLPTDAVRLTRLVTGTYSTTQTYKVTFTTNLNSQWRTAYDNLSTAKNYTLDMSSAALGLASNEYVTQFMLSFGIVPAGFHQLTNATVDAQTLYALTNGYKFTNKADVGGLLGGHSGAEIDKGRGNANLLMGRVLYAVGARTPLRLVSVAGGLKDNAIPRESRAVIAVADAAAAQAAIADMDAALRHEYAAADPDVSVRVDAAQAQQPPMDEASTQRAVCMLCCLPNGIQAMSRDIPGLVQLSLIHI